MFDSPVIPMIVFFLSFAAIFVLRGPFGKALAERLAGRSPSHERAIADLRAEVDQLRDEVTAVQERLDFAERVLARPAEPRPLGSKD